MRRGRARPWSSRKCRGARPLAGEDLVLISESARYRTARRRRARARAPLHNRDRSQRNCGPGAGRSRPSWTGVDADHADGTDLPRPLAPASPARWSRSRPARRLHAGGGGAREKQYAPTHSLRIRRPFYSRSEMRVEIPPGEPGLDGARGSRPPTGQRAGRLRVEGSRTGARAPAEEALGWVTRYWSRASAPRRGRQARRLRTTRPLRCQLAIWSRVADEVQRRGPRS